MQDGAYQVTTPYLCAGYVIKNGKLTQCAPILRKKFAYWQTIAKQVDDFPPDPAPKPDAPS